MAFPPEMVADVQAAWAQWIKNSGSKEAAGHIESSVDVSSRNDYLVCRVSRV